MNERIEQNVNLLFPPFLQTDIVCVLCDGSHGNNSLCQMPSEGDSYEIC
jgi:hypothetical protein